MAFRALDHSSRLTDPDGFAKAAKAAGFAAVLRYLPLSPGTLQNDNVGRLTAEEVAAYHAAGLGIGIVWETTQYRPIMGAAGGSVDGFQARTAANGLGFPPDHPIFGAVDFAPTPGQLPLVTAYLQTAGFEPYANGPTLTHLQAAHSWMHNWGGSDFPDPHIHQQGGQITVAGISCDLNDCYHDDCIWWPPGTQPQPVPQPLGEEDGVLCFTDATGHKRCEPDGSVYAFDPHGNPGGRYLGGLNTHPDWKAGQGQANGPPFIFGPTPEGGYVITTKDVGGQFHPYVFPPDGSLAHG
jgi:Domain of unknown function (DUF1906)